MSASIPNLQELLSSMDPVLNEGVYVFASLSPDRDWASLEPVAMMREHEGVTVVVSEETAERLQLPILFRAAWIALTVQSDLQAIGFTGAFSTALGRANISCNVIAGAIHDHIFVPVGQAQQAMSILRALSSS